MNDNLVQRLDAALAGPAIDVTDMARSELIALMGAQRLQQLREEFETECDCAWGRGDRSEDAKNQVEEIANWPDKPAGIHRGMMMLREIARRYIIARDFNEFDPGKADMLWKLQNGGVL
ncbi:hypothetical protein [Sphingomonas paucimobilis]|uniref:hypothetical protein n=1 Tax=Sphingomonas paucimobilis TaxID=13689 RepID=UPI0031D879B2